MAGAAARARARGDRLAVLVNRSTHPQCAMPRSWRRRCGPGTPSTCAMPAKSNAPSMVFATPLRMRVILIAARCVRSSPSELLATLTARHELPAVYSAREFVAAGGLISYGALDRPVPPAPPPMSTGSSRARSRPICRSSSRPNSSWSSTSRPRRRSASTVPPTLLGARRRGDRIELQFCCAA